MIDAELAAGRDPDELYPVELAADDDDADATDGEGAP